MPAECLGLAIVTGAARRLGRLFALTLARRGYALLLHYHASADDAQQTALEISALGCPVFPVRADLRTPQGLEMLLQALDSVLRKAGLPLRVLVNSAAVMPRQDLRTLSLDEWDATLALNLRAPFRLTQGAVERMTKGGLVVNVTDIGAHKTWTRYPAYVVSKAALETLTRLQARAYAPTVRVNALALGLALPSETLPAEEWEALIRRTPLGRTLAPEEIAAALEFLLDTPALTGHVLTLDGGYSLV